MQSIVISMTALAEKLPRIEDQLVAMDNLQVRQKLERLQSLIDDLDGRKDQASQEQRVETLRKRFVWFEKNMKEAKRGVEELHEEVEDVLDRLEAVEQKVGVCGGVAGEVGSWNSAAA